MVVMEGTRGLWEVQLEDGVDLTGLGNAFMWSGRVKNGS